MPPRNVSAEQADSAAGRLGAELRYWRQSRGLSAAELAVMVHRDRRTITAAEAGRDVPSEAVISALDTVLGGQGLLISHYDAVLAEKRRRRLNRGLTWERSPLARDEDGAEFLAETVPDGTLMTPGHRFEKTWVIRNSGTEVWSERSLRRVGIAAGSGLISTPVAIPVPETGPGEQVTLLVPCVAHWAEGTSRAVFKMTDGQGRLFFPDRYSVGLQVQVTVVQDLKASARQ